MGGPNNLIMWRPLKIQALATAISLPIGHCQRGLDAWGMLPSEIDQRRLSFPELTTSCSSMRMVLCEARTSTALRLHREIDEVFNT